MTLTGMPPIQAPTTTGHPASLPAMSLRKEPSLRVEPSAKGGETNGTALRQGQGQTPPQPKPARQEGQERASAPPTILQIKIGEMLREQAEAIKDPQGEDETDKAEAKATDRADAAETRDATEAKDTAGTTDTDAAWPDAATAAMASGTATDDDKEAPATAPDGPEARS